MPHREQVDRGLTGLVRGAHLERKYRVGKYAVPCPQTSKFSLLYALSTMNVVHFRAGEREP